MSSSRSEAAARPPDAPPGLPSTALRRVAVRGGVLLLGARLLVQVFTWGVTILVARFLMPYDYGVLTAGSIFLGLCDLLAEAGIGKALVQKPEVSDSDLAEGFSLSLLLAMALYSAVLVFAAPIAAFFRNPDLDGYLRVAGLLLLLTPFRSTPLSLLERRLEMGRQASILVVSALIQSALTLTLAVLGWGFWSLLVGTAAARLAEAVLLAARASWTPRLAWPRRGSGILRFGVHVSAASFLWYLYSNADFAVLGRLRGPVELGYYAFAFGVVSLPVQKLTSNVNQVAYPVFCRLQHDRGRLRDWYLRLTALLGRVAVPAMTGLAVVADDAIVVLLGRKWLPAVLPLRLLSLVGALMVFGSSLPPLINALGRPDVNMKYALACTLIYPPAFVALGYPYGVTGVCLAWLVLYPVVIASFISLTRPLTSVGLGDLLGTQREVVLAAAVMALVVVAVRQAVEAGSPALRLVLTVGVGIAAYGSMLSVISAEAIRADLRTIRASLR